MRTRCVLTIAVASWVCVLAVLEAADGQELDLNALNGLADAFEARVYEDEGEKTLPYRLFTPTTYDASKSYPLVMFLHGGGGAGDDNVKNFSGGNVPGSRVWALPAQQAVRPCFIFVPQSPPRGGGWRGDYGTLAIAALDALTEEFSVEVDRIYITGQSMGGMGTWHLINAYPGRFAAAVPVCGMAHLDNVPNYVKAGTAVWGFHGADDAAVPVAGTSTRKRSSGGMIDPKNVGTRTVIEAMRKAGASPKYTEYPGVGHRAWEHAYAEPELPKWLFAQRRTDSGPKSGPP